LDLFPRDTRLFLAGIATGWFLSSLLSPRAIQRRSPAPLSERVKDIARDPGRKIEAIKVYREETGAGLAEAKGAVEAYVDSLEG